MDGDGWNPPYLGLSDIQAIDINDFYSGAGSSCQQYSQNINTAANNGNVPEAIVAAIAMQESSCDATATGPTPGLMQVSTTLASALQT